MLLRRIDRRGRVIEDQHSRIGENRPGDGDPLPLAPAQGETTFAEQRVVPLRQIAHEIMGAGQLGRSLDLIGGCIRIGKGDVRGDGVVKQQGVLEDHPDGMAQIVDAQAAQVTSVEQDAAPLHVVEP